MNSAADLRSVCLHHGWETMSWPGPALGPDQRPPKSPAGDLGRASGLPRSSHWLLGLVQSSSQLLGLPQSEKTEKNKKNVGKLIKNQKN